MKPLLSTPSEQDDLRIAHYIDDANLPLFLRDLMPLATTDSERDMLLLSALAGAGCAMPNYYALHGPNAKRYYPNLLLFIEARAAQGKSIASIAERLLLPLAGRDGLFLSADSTHAAFADNLARQSGRGFCYESEGSVITDVWRRNSSGYNALLRKAAEHEDYTLSRKTSGDLVIPSPRLTMIITGTFDQYRALVPSAANGLFSRIIPLVIREQTEFDRNIFLASMPSSMPASTSPAPSTAPSTTPSTTPSSITPSSSDTATPPTMPSSADTNLPLAPNEVYGERVPVGGKGALLLLLHDRLAALEAPVRFMFTPEQAADLGETFYAHSLPLVRTLGANFHQSVARMAVHTLRIAMILTALRQLDYIADSPADSDFPLPLASAIWGKGADSSAGKGLLCSDSDYHTARLIGTKLLLHAADAYSQIGADLTAAIPRVRFSLQQQTLLSSLPAEFTTSDCDKCADMAGIPVRTARSWLERWIVNGNILRVQHGQYRKIA